MLLYHYYAAARRQLKILCAIVLNLPLRTRYTANVNSDAVKLADGETVVKTHMQYAWTQCSIMFEETD